MSDFAELGRQYVVDVTGAVVSLVAAARSEVLETGHVSIWGSTATGTFAAPLSAATWALVDPLSVVEHMSEWVAEYKAERGWV